MRRLMILIAALAVLVAPMSAVAEHEESGVVSNFGPNLEAVCHMPEGTAVGRPEIFMRRPFPLRRSPISASKTGKANWSM